MYTHEIIYKYTLFNMHIYVALPIFEKASDTINMEPAAWLGTEYRNTINNRLEPDEKEQKYQAFARKPKFAEETKFCREMRKSLWENVPFGSMPVNMATVSCHPCRGRSGSKDIDFARLWSTAGIRVIRVACHSCCVTFVFL